MRTPLLRSAGTRATSAASRTRVWSESYRGGARTVDIHIRRLRAKLGVDWFETIRGVGYKFRRRR